MPEENDDKKDYITIKKNNLGVFDFVYLFCYSLHGSGGTSEGFWLSGITCADQQYAADHQRKYLYYHKRGFRRRAESGRYHHICFKKRGNLWIL
jgi:hypothetical protein